MCSDTATDLTVDLEGLLLHGFAGFSRHDCHLLRLLLVVQVQIAMHQSLTIMLGTCAKWHLQNSTGDMLMDASIMLHLQVRNFSIYSTKA